MTAVTFRRARITDLPAIIMLLADDILGRQREDASSPLDLSYREAFQAIDVDANQLQAVAILDNEVVGTFHLTFILGLAQRCMARADRGCANRSAASGTGWEDGCANGQSINARPGTADSCS